MNKYIRHTEESALSLYPLEISQSGADLMELANMLMSKSEGQKYPSGATVGINPVAGLLVKDIGSLSEFLNSSTLFFNNDLKEIKAYLDDPDIGLKDADGYVKYVYSSNLNVYRRIPVRDSVTAERIIRRDTKRTACSITRRMPTEISTGHKFLIRKSIRLPTLWSR